MIFILVAGVDGFPHFAVGGVIGVPLPVGGVNFLAHRLPPRFALCSNLCFPFGVVFRYIFLAVGFLFVVQFNHLPAKYISNASSTMDSTS